MYIYFEYQSQGPTGAHDETNRLGPGVGGCSNVLDAIALDCNSPTDASDDEAIYCDRRRYGARCPRTLAIAFSMTKGGCHGLVTA